MGAESPGFGYCDSICGQVIAAFWLLVVEESCFRSWLGWTGFSPGEMAILKLLGATDLHLSAALYSESFRTFGAIAGAVVAGHYRRDKRIHHGRLELMRPIPFNQPLVFT